MFQSLKNYFDKQHQLSSDEWDVFKKHLSQKQLDKKTIITFEGKIEKFLYFIVKGGVRKYYLKNGKEYSIDFRFENQFVSGYFGLWVPPFSVYGCHFKRPCNVTNKFINFLL